MACHEVLPRKHAKLPAQTAYFVRHRVETQSRIGHSAALIDFHNSSAAALASFIILRRREQRWILFQINARPRIVYLHYESILLWSDQRTRQHVQFHICRRLASLPHVYSKTDQPGFSLLASIGQEVQYGAKELEVVGYDFSGQVLILLDEEGNLLGVGPDHTFNVVDQLVHVHETLLLTRRRLVVSLGSGCVRIRHPRAARQPSPKAFDGMAADALDHVRALHRSLHQLSLVVVQLLPQSLVLHEQSQIELYARERAEQIVGRARYQTRLLVHETFHLLLAMYHRIHDHLRELAQILFFGEAEPSQPGLAIDDAERAELVPPRSDEGDASVKSYEGTAGHEAVVLETGILVSVGYYEDFLAREDGMGAEGYLAGGFAGFPETAIAHEPLPPNIHQAHQTNRNVKNPARERRDPLEFFLVLGI
mmetsp:Transcript_27931/g.67303  ORF Transcript_27931/g.67303 Transcript_27931/m.67303 type:complete len:423 (-) Transcript_27931:378-1646(-)